MKKTIGVIHVLARCLDCDKKFSNYKNGQALAAQHAMKYRHLVTGEVGLSFEYDGREDSQQKETSVAKLD